VAALLKRLPPAPVPTVAAPVRWAESLQTMAAAGCRNLPKRVPVLAKPQDGTSMRNFSSAWETFSDFGESIATLSIGHEGYTSARPEVTIFILEYAYFALQNMKLDRSRA